jgi:hypothetical protein
MSPTSYQAAPPRRSIITHNLDFSAKCKFAGLPYPCPTSYFGCSNWWGPDGKKLDEMSCEALVVKLRELSANKFPDSGFFRANAGNYRHFEGGQAG